MVLKILMVDDSRVARTIMKNCLPEGYDYEIHEAENGKGGLEKFKEIRPDITFLDLNMPVMDGFECLENIMKVEENAKVVVVTANIQPKSLEKILELGAFGMLKKPLEKESFRSLFMRDQGKDG